MAGREREEGRREEGGGGGQERMKRLRIGRERWGGGGREQSRQTDRQVDVWMDRNMQVCDCLVALCSKCYHSYVQLVMEGERGGDRAAMEEGWAVLEEILEVLGSKAQVR